MNVVKKRGKGTDERVVRVVKRAVSLPRELDSEIVSLSKESHQPYSTVVKIALGSFVESVKKAELEKAYKSYYEDKATQSADAKLAGELFSASKRSWPD